jgi:hypothetical protein
MAPPSALTAAQRLTAALKVGTPPHLDLLYGCLTYFAASWKTRPAAVAGGAVLAAASGLWLGSTLLQYALAGRYLLGNLCWLDL